MDCKLSHYMTTAYSDQNILKIFLYACLYSYAIIHSNFMYYINDKNYYHHISKSIKNNNNKCTKMGIDLF